MIKTFEEISANINIVMAGRIEAMKAITFPGDIYLFGIWSGMSTKLISNYLDKNEIGYDKMFGLDSFMGLPFEKDGVLRHPGHSPGTYSSSSLYECTPEESAKIIQEGIGNEKLKLIPGFYSSSLRKELIQKENMEVASYVDIDVDLMISTYVLLDFMISNSLVKAGTVIYFDDWGATQEYAGGESLAWKAIVDKYQLDYEEIFSYGKRPNIQKVFIIK